MTALLLTIFGYSTASYICSGSICYLLAKAPRNNNNFQKLLKLWVVVFWPLWIFQEINKEDNPPQLFEQPVRSKDEEWGASKL